MAYMRMYLPVEARQALFTVGIRDQTTVEQYIQERFAGHVQPCIHP